MGAFGVQALNSRRSSASRSDSSRTATRSSSGCRESRVRRPAPIRRDQASAGCHPFRRYGCSSRTYQTVQAAGNKRPTSMASGIVWPRRRAPRAVRTRKRQHRSQKHPEPDDEHLVSIADGGLAVGASVETWSFRVPGTQDQAGFAFHRHPGSPTSMTRLAGGAEIFAGS
jgi:hypothetical protein